ncbi:MAG: SpoIIIAC/SpoIIIAD family protein [bacterium]|nr:SpoIIIAC/SpoIIIAD family protein [bacterium]
MNELMKILGIGLAGGAVVMAVRKYNSIYGMLTALALGAFILVSLCGTIEDILGELSGIIETGGLNKEYIGVVLKVIGIAYLSQFGAEMLRDSGEGAIAAKCELAGKIFILYLTMPVVADFLKLCITITEGI